MNAPPTVFSHEGRQYIVAYSAGNVLIGSDHGDSVWLFALDGALGPATPGDTRSADAATAAPSALAQADPAAGFSIYQQTCVPCHGDDGTGGHGGGAELVNLRDLETTRSIVSQGLTNMPGFAGALSEQDILDVASYVLEEFNE